MPTVNATAETMNDFTPRLRKPYHEPRSPWPTTHDGGDSPEFIAWAEALVESEAPEGALEIALVDLIVQAARRLKRVMRDLDADACRDRALVRELTACERSWSKALGEWRRHRSSKYAKDKAKAKAEASVDSTDRLNLQSTWDRMKAEAEASIAETLREFGDDCLKTPDVANERTESTPAEFPDTREARPSVNPSSWTKQPGTAEFHRVVQHLTPDRADQVPLTAARPDVDFDIQSGAAAS